MEKKYANYHAISPHGLQHAGQATGVRKLSGSWPRILLYSHIFEKGQHVYCISLCQSPPGVQSQFHVQFLH